MSDIISCMWTSFAHTGNPNGGPDRSMWPPNCETVHGRVMSWPKFDSRRLYYTLQTSPVVTPLQVDNKSPNDEFPSDKKCDVLDTISYPWHAANGSAWLLRLMV